MPAEVMIVTGSRTPIDSLLTPSVETLGARCAGSNEPSGAYGRPAGAKSAKSAQSPEEQSKQADRHRRLHQHGAVEACFKGGNFCTQVGLRR